MAYRIDLENHLDSGRLWVLHEIATEHEDKRVQWFADRELEWWKNSPVGASKIQVARSAMLSHVEAVMAPHDMARAVIRAAATKDEDPETYISRFEEEFGYDGWAQEFPHPNQDQIDIIALLEDYRLTKQLEIDFSDA